MSIEDNKATVRRVFEEVWNQGQVALIDELCAPDAIFHNPQAPDVHTREDVKRMITQGLSAFPDFHFTIEDMIAEGEQVVARLTYRATHTGEFVMPGMRFPATGKQMTGPEIFIARFAGGKIVEAWDQADDLGAFQQLGLIPMPQAVG